MKLKNAVLHTMEGIDYENGWMTVENGVITGLGPMGICPQQPGEEWLDLDGAHIYPGFIDAHTHLGMWEDGLTFEGDDGNEETDPITPQLRAIDALNPMDRCFREALESGVTTVITGPGSANPIGGQLAAIKTAGHCIDKMIVKAPVAMKMALGENPKTVYHGKNQTPVTRMATAALIREQLRKAERYLDDTERALAEEDFDPPEYDIKCEALLPLLRREIPAHIHCHRADDIFTAIRIAEGSHSLRPFQAGAAEPDPGLSRKTDGSRYSDRADYRPSGDSHSVSASVCRSCSTGGNGPGNGSSRHYHRACPDLRAG